MCGTGPTWKREVVPDHKFDFVDTREFTDNGCGMRSKYLWLYLIVLKSFLVYILDIFSATTMLSTDKWNNEIFRDCEKGLANKNQTEEAKENEPKCIAVNFTVGKWLFVGCIIFSFLLLAYEARKTKKIIASRDISYAFTNVMANHYYSLRSYDHFCFFDHISNSTKLSDDFAFFVFFTFKDWKRLLLADAPRQTINALILYSVFLRVNNNDEDKRDWFNPLKYVQNDLGLSTNILSVTTFFTVTVCAGSILLMLGAAICYIPLLFHIRGNLKEYCCHQVDKRISTVIKRRQKQRLADAAELAKKEARGDYSHLKNKNGELVGKPLPQPTLPNISLDDDLDASSINTKQPPPSTYTQDYNSNYYYNSAEKMDYPPMPGYNHYAGDNPQYASSHGHGQYGSDDKYYYQGAYEDDNASTANLALGAAPFAHQSAVSGIDRMGSPMALQGAYDPRDVYQGRGGTPANDPYRGATPANDPYRNGTPANDPYRGATPANDPYRGATPANDPYRGATPANDPYRGTTPANDPYRGTTPAPQYHPTGYNDGYSNYGGAPNHGGQHQPNNGYGNQGGGGGSGYAM